MQSEYPISKLLSTYCKITIRSQVFRAKKMCEKPDLDFSTFFFLFEVINKKSDNFFVRIYIKHAYSGAFSFLFLFPGTESRTICLALSH